MRSIVITLLAVAMFAAAPALNLGKHGQAYADEISSAEDIHAVISSQLGHFNADNAAQAFAHASPKIQAMFGSADRFISMVKRGYPQIYRSQAARFLDLGMQDGALIQKVLVTGKDGRAVVAAYAMVEVDGVWRIDGCELLKQPGTAA
ncbi:MAG: DUF4864 domain-containing protein [Pseudomonadota bacterium]